MVAGTFQTQNDKERSVSFNHVEVIELPIVAGEDHPSEMMEFASDQNVDSAAITLGWEAQARTRMDVDAFEKKRRFRVGKKLRRMFRAVRKRM